MRTELPVVTQVSGGYQLKCAACSFKKISLHNPRTPGVHLCNDRVAVKWEGAEVHGQPTSPPNAAYLHVLAQQEAKKARR